MTTSRRSFITGLVSLIAAPAIVRVGSLMPVKSVSLKSIITPSEMGIDLGGADLYGISPMMSVLPYLREWNAQQLRELFPSVHR